LPPAVSGGGEKCLDDAQGEQRVLDWPTCHGFSAHVPREAINLQRVLVHGLEAEGRGLDCAMATSIADVEVAGRRSCVRIGKIAAQPALAAEHRELLVGCPIRGTALCSDGKARMAVAIIQ